MKLAHAVKLAEKLLQRTDLPLAQEERVAVRVLVRMAARVTDAKASIRALGRAVYGEDLNQDEINALFSPPKEG